MTAKSTGTRCAFFCANLVCWGVCFCSALYAEPQKLAIEIGLLGCSDHRDSDKWLMGEISSFMAAHPAITVKVTEWGLARESRELEEALVLPKNIIGICSVPGYETAYLARRDEIVPIETFLPDPEFTMDSFYPNLWRPVQFAGKTWGVPWATMVPVLIWSPTLFAKAGIAGPPATWEDFMECAKLLTKDLDEDGIVDQVGCAPLKLGALGFLAAQIAVQKEVFFITDKGYVSYSDGVAEIFALTRRMALLVNEINSGAAYGARYAMGLAKTSSSELLKYGQDPDYRLAPLPSIGPSKALGNFGSLYLAVRKSTPEQEAASWKLIKWISRKDVALPSALHGYPVRKDFVDREDFAAFSDKWFHGARVAWENNQYLVEFGSQAVVDRYEGLKRLLVSVQMGMATGEAARTAWNAATDDLNAKLVILPELGNRKYELFK